MEVSMGSCCGCNKPIVYLKWRDERVVIVVGCKDCKVEVEFDLETMYAVLMGNEDEEDSQMRLLREFVPKGKPN